MEGKMYVKLLIVNIFEVIESHWTPMSNQQQREPALLEVSWLFFIFKRNTADIYSIQQMHMKSFVSVCK